MGDDLQPEPEALGRHRLRNAAKAQHSQGLAFETGKPLRQRRVPLAAARGGKHLGQVPGLRQQERNGVRRHLVDRIVRHIRHPNAARGGGRDINGIQAGAYPADNAAASQVSHQAGWHLLDGHHQGIGLAGDCQLCRCLETVRVDDGGLDGGQHLGFDGRILGLGVSNHNSRHGSIVEKAVDHRVAAIDWNGGPGHEVGSG